MIAHGEGVAILCEHIRKSLPLGRAAHRPYYGYGRRITVKTGRLKYEMGRVG